MIKEKVSSSTRKYFLLNGYLFVALRKLKNEKNTIDFKKISCYDIKGIYENVDVEE